MSRSLNPKVRLEKEEGQYLKIKLLLADIRLRTIAEKFKVSRSYVQQILDCERYRPDIVEYVRQIPEPEGLKKVLNFKKNQKAA